ncbi:hypothetical protein EJB05_11866, partial [Eragrostis curvula]
MAHAAVAAALSGVLLRRVDAAALGPVLSQGQSLGANDTLVSANGVFVLGFFAPRGGDQGRRYLGVMYARAAEQTVPWVANRDAPVSAASKYSATVTASGELQVLEGDRVAWRTNTSSSSSPSPVGGNVTLTLLDSGNLVLASGSGEGNALWQSFDHPADTFLPGMRIALDRRNGTVKRTLFTSWRSSVDPGAGDFTLGLDPLGSAQLYIWKNGSTTYWRSGQWANTSFVGVPWRSLSVHGFKLNVDQVQGEGLMYYTFSTYNATLYRSMLHPNGTETCYMLIDATGEWEAVWSQHNIPCQEYNTCGANAVCAGGENGQNSCTCLEGFKPRSAAGYGNGKWTHGCVRNASLTCEDDQFLEIPRLKLPNLATWVGTVKGKQQCRWWCLGNCSCGAYSYSIGTGCLTWGHELLDIYQFPYGGYEEGYDLSFKVHTYPKRFSKTKRWTAGVVIVVIVVVVALAACSFLLWKCRRRFKGEGIRSYYNARVVLQTQRSPCTKTDKLAHPAEKLGIGGTEQKRPSRFLSISEEAVRRYFVQGLLTLHVYVLSVRTYTYKTRSKRKQRKL